jgi:uncharacterized protein
MRTVFADTYFWVARLVPGETHHLAARGISASETLTIVTTEEVFTELLNLLSSRGPHLRALAVGSVEALATHPHIEVVPQSHDTFLAGCALYNARLDKGYSLTDCISMVAMRARGITEVLTHDRHFSQEGFVALM